MSTKKNKGYVRVSTMKESQKDSPEHQLAFIKEMAHREGIEIDSFYEDRDTATSIVAREDVQKMIADAKRGEINSIWFASLSRFSRDALDAISLKRILVNALKIRVVSIEDGYDSAKNDDEVLFGVKSVINQNQSQQISVASRRGIRQSAALGNFIGSIAPYGYKKITVADPKMKNGERKTLEIIPEQAEMVKMIFDMYVNRGMGEKSIVDYLNGADGKHEPIPAYRGGLWGLSSVQRLLQNENYTGYTVYGRHTTEVTYNDLSDLMDRGSKLVQKPKTEWQRTDFQTHEAIISKEMFDKAQEIRLLRGGGAKGGRRNFINVFAKLIFCAECGSAMVTMKSKTNNNSGKEYRYLMCSRRRRMGKPGCDNGKWLPYFEFRDELIEGILIRISESLGGLESQGMSSINPSMQNNNLAKDREKLEKQIEDNRRLLFEIRRRNMLGEIDDAQYDFEKEQYEKEIESAEKRIMIIKADENKSLNVTKLIKDARKSLKELGDLKAYDDVKKTRSLLMQAVQRIEVNKDQEITIKTYI